MAVCTTRNGFGCGGIVSSINGYMVHHFSKVLVLVDQFGPGPLGRPSKRNWSACLRPHFSQ